MKKKGTFEVKTHLSEILEDIQKGEEILITKRGEPVALMIPYKQAKPDVKSIINDFRKWRENITWGKGMTIKEAISKGRR